MQGLKNTKTSRLEVRVRRGGIATRMQRPSSCPQPCLGFKPLNGNCLCGDIPDFRYLTTPPSSFPGKLPSTQHPYHPETRGRRPFAPTLGQCLDQRSLLKDVSWSLDSTIVRKSARASAAICHREEAFGNPSSTLVVKLQEAHPESSAILEHR
jgi:hypothetical protein